MAPIRVAIAGVGNCASNFVQGVERYRRETAPVGLIHEVIGGYAVSDIVPVLAFDVDARKVGRDLSDAIFAPPNCTPKFTDVPRLGAPVLMGPILDGVPEHLTRYIETATAKPAGVGAALREYRADILVNLLPTGSEEASRLYIAEAIAAGVGVVNGIPVLICHDSNITARAEQARVPLIGDDFKSQLGGTVLHRALLHTCVQRGVRIRRSYQLNYGGNTDFYNLMHRGEAKHASKLRGIRSVMPYDADFSVNVSHLGILGDTKICRVFIEGENFAGAPLRLEATLEVVDSANSSGVLVDAIRCCKLGLDRGMGGVLVSPSAFFMKSPPVQAESEDIAMSWLEDFVAGSRER